MQTANRKPQTANRKPQTALTRSISLGIFASFLVTSVFLVQSCKKEFAPIETVKKVDIGESEILNFTKAVENTVPSLSSRDEILISTTEVAVSNIESSLNYDYAEATKASSNVSSVKGTIAVPIANNIINAENVQKVYFYARTLWSTQYNDYSAANKHAIIIDLEATTNVTNDSLIVTVASLVGEDEPDDILLACSNVFPLGNSYPWRAFGTNTLPCAGSFPADRALEKKLNSNTQIPCVYYTNVSNSFIGGYSIRESNFESEPLFRAALCITGTKINQFYCGYLSQLSNIIPAGMKKITISIQGNILLGEEYKGNLSWVGKYDDTYFHLGSVYYGTRNVKKADCIIKKF